MAKKSLAELYDEVVNFDTHKIQLDRTVEKSKHSKKTKKVNAVKAKDKFDKKIGIKRSIEKRYLLKVKPIWNFIPIFIAIPIGFFVGFLLYLTFVTL